MKRLYLLRHAKSSWRDATLDDAARPLNKRGRSDAPRMGAALGRRLPPMTFHCSPAQRAQLTFAGLCAGWSGLQPQDGIVDDALYSFDVNALLDWIGARPEEGQELAIIGHNPALTELVNRLAGPATLENLPTAGWVELDLPILSWSDIGCVHGSGAADFMLFPRSLQGSG